MVWSRMWPIMVSGKNLGRGLMCSTVILYLFTPGLHLPGLSEAGMWLVVHADMELLFLISHVCHFGGGLAGVIFVRRLLRRPPATLRLGRKPNSQTRRPCSFAAAMKLLNSG